MRRYMRASEVPRISIHCAAQQIALLLASPTGKENLASF